MTMAFSAPLQRALYERLTTAPALSALGGRVFDEAPHRSLAAADAPYATIGDETVAPWETATERGAVHEAMVRLHAPARGFLALKALAAAVSDEIEANPPTPETGRVVSARFISARTAREADGALRRIDLRFRFVLEDEL